MRLAQLGWDTHFERSFSELNQSGRAAARVCEVNKGYYRALTESGEFLSQVTGLLRYQAEESADLPTVGDWVAIEPRTEERRATIFAVLPRRTALVRKMPGKAVRQQVLAANLDVVFIVTSLNQEFNLRRIERYLAVVGDSGARPVVLLNKADLCADVDTTIELARRLDPRIPVYSLSGLTGDGLDAIDRHVQAGQTAAFIGSSGVGKSTIINRIMGDETQRVQPVRDSDDRGRHTTTSRQLFVRSQGGIVIDTPGIRELGLWTQDSGLSQAFDDLGGLAQRCRFRDCSHHTEPGCAVRESIEQGCLPVERLNNFHKMQAEIRFMKSKTDLWTRQAAKKRAKKMCGEFKRWKTVRKHP